MKRKITLLLLSALCISTLAFGVAACSMDGQETETGTNADNSTGNGQTADDGSKCNHDWSLSYEIYESKHAQTCSGCNERRTDKHKFFEGYCVCGYKEPVNGTDGLAYTLNDDKESYSLSGIGTATETEIKIPSNHWGLPVTAIATKAFYNNSTINKVVIPDSVTSIGEEAFEMCTKLTSVTIPNSVTTICDAAFAFCESLTSLTIPSRVTSIGAAAFESCMSLTSVNIPSSVTALGVTAFDGCNLLASIQVAADNPNYKSIDGNLYSKDGIELLQYAIGKTDTSFTIPNEVTRIGAYAFGYCLTLKDVTISSSVKEIGERAFCGCENIENVIIPANINIIEKEAFYECASINVNCEAGEKPSDWDENWNVIGHTVAARPKPIYCTVVWGYTGENN